MVQFGNHTIKRVKKRDYIHITFLLKEKYFLKISKYEQRINEITLPPNCDQRQKYKTLTPILSVTFQF